MSDTIRITGITAFGYHGVLAHERAEGQEFIVDVAIETDYSKAAEADDVTETINYALVADLVLAEITGAAVNLIETLADQIASKILAMPNAIAVEVTVHKPYAPIEVAFLDVSVTRRLP